MAVVAEVYVGGCRASGGGLHLGHLYGCFQGVQLTAEDSYYFVVSDCISGNRQAIHDSVLEIFRDVLCVSEKYQRGEIHVVRESGLRRALAPLQSAIESVASYGLLRSSHPRHSRLKRGQFEGTIGDLTFPVHQASFLLGLRCTVACYNDDNADVVRFARECGRRVNAHFGSSLLNSNVQLIGREPSRLYGFDGRKMSKLNQNFLSTSVSPSSVSRFTRRLIGRSFGSDVDIGNVPCTDAEIGLVKLTPTLALDDYTKIRDVRQRLGLLTDALTVMIERFRDGKSSIVESLTSRELENRLISEEKLAANTITKFLDNWWDAS